MVDHCPTVELPDPETIRAKIEYLDRAAARLRKLLITVMSIRYIEQLEVEAHIDTKPRHPGSGGIARA